jgi:hypothetical protein
MRLAGRPFPHGAIWPAGVEPAVSGSRNRRDVRLPYSQLIRDPRRDSNPRFRAENPASQPLDHGGVSVELSRRSWNRTRPCSISASRASTDTDLRGSGGRSRTCVSRSTVARLAVRPHRNDLKSRKRKERESNPQRPKAAPVFETGYRAGGSPSEGGPGRSRTCTVPSKSRQLSRIELRSRECGRQASNPRRVAFQATALPC